MRPLRPPSGWLLCPPDMSPPSTSLPSGAGASGSAGAFSAPALESAVSARGPGSFSWGVVFRNQGVSTKGAHCYWGVAPRPSQWTELGTACMHTHRYPLVSVSSLYPMTVCLPVISLGNFKFTRVPPVSLQHHTVYSNDLFPYLELSLPTVRKLASIIVDVFTDLVSPPHVTNFQLLHVPSLAPSPTGGPSSPASDPPARHLSCGWSPSSRLPHDLYAVFFFQKLFLLNSNT